MRVTSFTNGESTTQASGCKGRARGRTPSVVGCFLALSGLDANLREADRRPQDALSAMSLRVEEVLLLNEHPPQGREFSVPRAHSKSSSTGRRSVRRFLTLSAASSATLNISSVI